MTRRRDRAFPFSGEHRLPACSCRQLAGNIKCTVRFSITSCISASCRDGQASGLCSPDQTVARSELRRSLLAQAQIFTRLFYRHWSAYTEFKRSHLFIIGADADATTAARDLTPGDHDVPPFNLGGQDMYAISPDGQELAYTSNIDEVEATSTNNEIFIVPMAGGTAKKISTSPGSDATPLYSPDGKYFAWRSQARAGFEADKWRLFLLRKSKAPSTNLQHPEKLQTSITKWRTV